jgi:hypothetical protein
VDRTRLLHIENPVDADRHEQMRTGPSKSRNKSATKILSKNGPAKSSPPASAVTGNQKESPFNGVDTMETSLVDPSDAANQITAGDALTLNKKIPEIEVLKRDLEKSTLAKRKAELDRLHAALLEEKRMLQSSFKVSFQINPDYSGHIVGRNGSILTRAQEIPNVRRVDLKDGEVTIYADTFEAAECARDMLEIECLEIPITPRERSLIVGRGGKNVRDLQVISWLSVVCYSI